MSAGAFSDDGVVKASGKLVPIFVDCDWGKANKDLTDKYNVGGYPTVIFIDPDGKQIEEMNGRDADGIIKQIEEIATKFPGGPATFESWEKALEKAKEDKKPVLYVFTTAKDDSKALEKALGDDSLKALLDEFVLAKSAIKKDNKDAKTFSVATSDQPVILILDPAAEKPEAKPLKKLTGKKSAKDLKKELEEVLKKFKGGG